MEIEQRIAHLIKHGNLRLTETRKIVLLEFIKAGNQALSSSEIEQKFEDMDRITLYRTLKTFEEAGLIHKAVDVTGKSKYALCSEDCSNDHHNDHHAHFYCKKCEKTVCLDDVSIPNIKLPANYQLDDQQLLLSGVCDECL